MKKLYAAAASLLLASTAAMASVPVAKTGALTIGLTAAYTEGGFAGGEYETVLSESPYRSQYKSVAKTAKFTNTEFIQALIDGEYLEESSASDWNLVVAYLQLDEEESPYIDTTAFFAIGNSNVGNAVVYLGGDDFYGPYGEFPLSVVSDFEGLYGESISESSVYTETASGYAYKGRARGKESSLITMFVPVPYNYEYYDSQQEAYFVATEYRPILLTAIGVNNFNESYSYSYNNDTETELDIYTPAASSITSIVGATSDYGYDNDGGDELGYDSPLVGAIITGSLKAAALTDVTDEELMYTLFQTYFNAVGYYEP